jgi:hypothetical protein
MSAWQRRLLHSIRQPRIPLLRMHPPTPVDGVQQQEPLHDARGVRGGEYARPAGLAGSHGAEVRVPHQQPQVAVADLLPRQPLARHLDQIGPPGRGQLCGAQLVHLQ